MKPASEGKGRGIVNDLNLLPKLSKPEATDSAFPVPGCSPLEKKPLRSVYTG